MFYKSTDPGIQKQKYAKMVRSLLLIFATEDFFSRSETPSVYIACFLKNRPRLQRRRRRRRRRLRRGLSRRARSLRSLFPGGQGPFDSHARLRAQYEGATEFGRTFTSSNSSFELYANHLNFCLTLQGWRLKWITQVDQAYVLEADWATESTNLQAYRGCFLCMSVLSCHPKHFSACSNLPSTHDLLSTVTATSIYEDS